ncbi:CIA30 family protein [Changchengzhania lutea]|uniref:CIA30 family protein n=1 Tax=Changchengzhania lutea TaxID=2049305 RepID=UPI00115DE281|nr:CIA30 family protein [Changchengzhania lutea]
MILFKFNNDSNISDWRIVDDVVMGGKSSGSFNLSNSGTGVFEGYVSLENNGGFSIVQFNFETKNVNALTTVVIKLKGDGKNYQFRVKSNTDDDFSYVVPFETTGDWQTITIPFDSMYPTFRGRKLDAVNFPGKSIEMIAFLIANKKEESFKLEIDSIILM